MSSKEIIFKHPPASDVQLGVTFANNLEVADQRSRFHALVRAEFPVVVIPEQTKMTFDFADYSLFTEDQGTRLEIGMNYFRLASTRYPGFAKFRTFFMGAVGVFSKCYNLAIFTSLAMTYRNTLPLEVHHKYEACFTLEVTLPDALRSELYAGQGILVIQKPEGLVTIQLEAQVKESRIVGYNMNLIFTVQPGASITADETSLASYVDVAHSYLERFFFGLLTEEYLDYLGSR